MSTNAYVGIRINKDEAKTVYVHWDGYVEWTGVKLHRYYNSKEKVEKLLELGDISSLRERIDFNSDEQHDFENPLSDVTVFYGRDRGESYISAEVRHFLKEESKPGSILNIEYAYIWNDDLGDFEVYEYGDYLGNLTDVIENLGLEE